MPTNFVNSRTLVRFIEMCPFTGCKIKRNEMRKLGHRDMLGLVTNRVLLKEKMVAEMQRGYKPETQL